MAGLDLAAGDELVWVSGGQRFTEEILVVKDGVATIRSSREGGVDQPLEFALPPVRWEGGPDGTGTNEFFGPRPALSAGGQQHEPDLPGLERRRP